MNTARIKSRWLAMPLLIFCGMAGLGLASANADHDPAVEQDVSREGGNICSELAQYPTTGAVQGTVDGTQIAGGFTHQQAVAITQLSVQRYCPQYLELVKQAGY